jgi:hypothetical protein
VAADINKLLRPKSYEQLQNLETQVKRKLNSNEPIDTDYWEELLRSLTVWKARARLRNVYQSIIDERVRDLRKQQKEEAESIRAKLAPLAAAITAENTANTVEFEGLDPEPLLKVRPEDKVLEIMDESALLDQVVCPKFLLVIHRSKFNRFYRLVNARKLSVWALSHCDKDQRKNPPWLYQILHLQMLQLPLHPLGFLQSRTKTFHKRPKRSMRESSPRVSARTRKSLLAKRPLTQARNLNGLASIGLENHGTSIEFKWVTNGTNTTKPITTMIIRHLRLYKVTNSTSFTPT